MKKWILYLSSTLNLSTTQYFLSSLPYIVDEEEFYRKKLTGNKDIVVVLLLNSVIKKQISFLVILY